jgi:hypothetical protein
MSVPIDIKLYNKVKKKIIDNNKINSAYRSGLIVKTYKQKFIKKYGDLVPPYYDGNKKPLKDGLKSWFKSEWVNINPLLNKEGYPTYRPTIRVNKDTPKTVDEIPLKRLKEQYELKQKYKQYKNLPKF